MVDAQLEQMYIDTLSDHGLEQYRAERGFKLGWIARQMVSRYGDKGLTRYQRMRGFHPNWVTKIRETIINQRKL